MRLRQQPSATPLPSQDEAENDPELQNQAIFDSDPASFPFNEIVMHEGRLVVWDKQSNPQLSAVGSQQATVHVNSERLRQLHISTVQVNTAAKVQLRTAFDSC